MKPDLKEFRQYLKDHSDRYESCGDCKLEWLQDNTDDLVDYCERLERVVEAAESLYQGMDVDDCYKHSNNFNRLRVAFMELDKFEG
jgi:hypothetical protein